MATYNATTFLNYQNAEVITPYLIGSGNLFRFDLRILDNTGSRLSQSDCSSCIPLRCGTAPRMSNSPVPL
ncbi:MAG: hypothetical protein MZU97_04505 [Bacillus subtilis]|nr:hypothetical protein [Bacillus subtilis]